MELYAAEGRTEHYPDIARDMVRQKPDVIVLALNHQLISEIAKETYPTPVVAWMGDPVAAELVKNLARPEGNITGVAGDAGIEMQGKHLEILRLVVPSASRIAYLSSRWDWEGAWGYAVVEAGRRSGISIIGVTVETWAGEPEYREAFEKMAQQSVEALEYNGLIPNAIYRYLIADLAVKYRLPCITWSLDVVETGQGLLGYADPRKTSWIAGPTKSH